MRYIENISEELEIFKALSSEVRIDILKKLMNKGRMSMNDLALQLGLTNGALTPHVRKLEETGLIRINTDSRGHGNLKVCEPHLDKILFVFTRPAAGQNEFLSHLRVGQYASCSIYPTCGLSTGECANWNWMAKLILIVNMYCGRIGTLTLAFALTRHKKESPHQYPDLYIMLG